MNVGKEIYEQLRTLGRDTLMVIGARGFTSFNENHFNSIPHLGGLFFRVSGLLHKQSVMIRLAPNDTYTVSIGKISKGVWINKKGFDDKTNVYFDELANLIDDLVEGTRLMSVEDKKEAYRNL